jgi:hypothetical protein
MLENRKNCENCNKNLAIGSTEAMICAFECTFCADCVSNILQNVCPNCGGGFERRPILPKLYREKYPASTKHIFKTVDMQAFQAKLAKNKTIEPKDR